MKQDLIVNGATGGLGRCLIKQALHESLIERIYCLYRNQEKFDTIFHEKNKKMVMERHIPITIEHIYRNQPSMVTCIFTGFAITPIKQVGECSEAEINANLQANIWDFVIFLNQLVKCCNNIDSELHLINIDSGAAYVPLKGWGLYSAAKSYINMYLKTLKLEKPRINIVSYEPGVMDTEMQQIIRNSDREAFDRVDEFRNYYKDGVLNQPFDVASDIIKRFVMNWTDKEFEVRYQK